MRLAAQRMRWLRAGNTVNNVPKSLVRTLSPVTHARVTEGEKRMFRDTTLGRPRVVVSAAVALSLLAAACGSDEKKTESTTAATTAATTAGSTAATTAGSTAATTAASAETPSGDTCVDGDSVELGFLNSTSGVMAISEQTVRDALLLAADEINGAGGIMGKQIKWVEEDGQSEPTVFAEKINKLLTEDNVAAVFGGWTSASRKAMLPVVEGANGLLFYPVQYEGLEASKNIYYTCLLYTSPSPRDS